MSDIELIAQLRVENENLRRVVAMERASVMDALDVIADMRVKNKKLREASDRDKSKPNDDLSKWDILAREFVQNAFKQMEKQQAEFNEELMCVIVRSEADFELHQTVLFFPEMNCCDMRGAINFAQRTDPKVKRIVTVSGENLDTVYYYDDDEEEPGWCASRSFVGKGRQWQR